jgi:hypothetical protein
MVSVTDRSNVVDTANKAVVLACADALLSITFTGVGSVHGEGVDRHTAIRLVDAEVPQMSARDAVRFLAEDSTRWFATFPETMKLGHAFVVAGWQYHEATPRPSLWVVSNMTTGNLGEVVTPSDRFEVVFDLEQSKVSGRRSFTYMTGLIRAASRPERRRLEARLRKAADIEAMEKAAVELIRSAARDPRSSQSIGAECMAITLLPSRQARAMYYPESEDEHAYGPYFVWKSNKANVLMGEIDVSGWEGKSIAIGGQPSPVTLVIGQTARGSLSGEIQDKYTVGGLVRVSGELVEGETSTLVSVPKPVRVGR